MDVALISLIGLVLLALLFDYTNGFHDSANSVATIIATRVLRPRFAVAWAAFFNFIAFLIFGTAVADTVGSTVKGAYVSLAVVFAALLGAITWNFGSWHLGLPTSSSHALIGGLAGAGLARGGLDAIEASSVRKALLFLVVSPAAGLVMAAVLILVLRRVLAGRDVERTERGFRWAQLVSSAAVSLGHGGNDAQKTMGVIAALLVATGHQSGSGDKLIVPMWVAVAAASALALGTYSGGWRIVRTMGMDITALRPVSGFAAETAGAGALFVSTAVGAPVSTTHTVAGSITGVGTTNSGATVNWRIFGRMAIAWVVTIPSAAMVAALAYWGTTIGPEVVSGVLMAAFLTALTVLVIASLRRAPKADDVAPDDVETLVPLRPGTGSIIGTGRPAGPTGAPRRRVSAGQPL
ncbi:inorganic phosphate transporter [Actinomadura sp. HBU206391]|uniref:inorganic phosphate transporter n=1 Tax=Actinomadura sp. HBU206391 TaxID=2731692 RepID=UPI00164FFA66|nr:inorganic phosphate transporter [Actinomadura sp. HBU206391]MBC6461658.1 inorganic phosphate transporter [Actinomadura sp. HBU206391]